MAWVGMAVESSSADVVTITGTAEIGVALEAETRVSDARGVAASSLIGEPGLALEGKASAVVALFLFLRDFSSVLSTMPSIERDIVSPSPSCASDTAVDRTGIVDDSVGVSPMGTIFAFGFLDLTSPMRSSSDSEF